MQIQSAEGGMPMSYFDDALASEVSVTTSGIPAETSGAGCG